MLKPSELRFRFLFLVKIFSGGTCFTPDSMIYYNPQLIFASPFLFFCRFDHKPYPGTVGFMKKR